MPRTAAEKLQSVIDNLTYKPGWRFWIKWRPTAIPHWPDDVILHMEFDAPDANEPERMTIIGRDMMLPQGLMQMIDGASAGIIRWVMYSIKEMEIHEVDEWLRIDGVRLKNPHDAPVRTAPLKKSLS
jgi:hypothetical protein